MVVHKWIIIHKSYGLPRAIYQIQRYMEYKSIHVKIEISNASQLIEYRLYVLESQKEQALRMLEEFKKNP